MNCNTCKCNKVCDHNKYGFENCDNYISADVVEVCRCKDCNFFRETDREYLCMIHFSNVVKDDFCSYGERSDT